MVNIFLSYSRDDQASARPLALALEECGHEVWWDRHITGGAQYAKEIDRALAAADVVLVLWSAVSIESAWVRDEAEVGRDSGRLVPVTLDDSRPPLGFRQYQTISLRGWSRTRDPADLSELLHVLDRLQGKGADRPEPVPRTALLGPVRPTRRKLLVGAGAAGLLGLAGVGIYRYREAHEPVPPEAQALMLQAQQLMEQNTQEGQYQAIGLYERVVKMLPDFAEGWGRLGIAYAVPSHYREKQEALRLRAKAEAAGRRALEIDPDSVYGEMALAVAPPFIGHWLERDQRTRRALAIEPRNDDLLILRGVVLQFDGRPGEAVRHYKQVRKRPFTPAVYANFIQALWSAGRLTELDDAMEDASALYPTQWTIWRNRFNILAYDGRTEAALAFLNTPEGRPDELEPGRFARAAQLARAIGSRNPGDVEAVMQQQKEAAQGSAPGAESAIRNAAALGRLDDAFAFAQAYYFSRGYAVPDFGDSSSVSLDQRQTRFLFEPVTRPMRADPRFEPLVAELGLDRFWRQAEVQPDYRRS